MRVLILIAAAMLMVSCSSALLTGGDYYKKEPRTEGVALSDTATTDRIMRRFVDDPVLANYRITVTTYKGRVTLTGSVADYRHRNRAGDIAKEVAGARVINNQIVVNDDSDPS